jgi:hypothetical protein
MKCALFFAFLGSIGSQSTIARVRAQEPVNPLADQSANLSNAFEAAAATWTSTVPATRHSSTRLSTEGSQRKNSWKRLSSLWKPD